MVASQEALKESLAPEMQADCPKGGDLHEKAIAFRACAEVKDRKHRLRTYKKCFIACDVVDSLVEKGTCSTREEAVQMGQQLSRELGLFEHACGEHEFKDEHLFFRFWYHREENEDGKEASMVPQKLLKKVKKVANKTVSNLKESLKGELVSEDSQGKALEEKAEDASQSTESQTELSLSDTEQEDNVDSVDDALGTSELGTSETDPSRRTSGRQRRRISTMRASHAELRVSRNANSNHNRISCRRSRVRRHRSKSLDTKSKGDGNEKDCTSGPPIVRQRSNSCNSGLRLKEDATVSDALPPSSSSSSGGETANEPQRRESDRAKPSCRRSNSSGTSSRGSSANDAKTKSSNSLRRSTSLQGNAHSSTAAMRRSTSLQGDAHSTAVMRLQGSSKRSPTRKSAMAVLSETNHISEEVKGLFQESSTIQEDEDEAGNVCKRQTTVATDKELDKSGREESGPKHRASTKTLEVISRLASQTASSSRTLEGISRLASHAASSTPALGWDCSCCGGKNMSSTHSFCGMCGYRKQEQPLLWECSSCYTKDNQARYKFCGGCGCARSSGSRSPVSAMPLAA